MRLEERMALVASRKRMPIFPFGSSLPGARSVSGSDGSCFRPFSAVRAVVVVTLRGDRLRRWSKSPEGITLKSDLATAGVNEDETRDETWPSPGGHV